MYLTKYGVREWCGSLIIALILISILLFLSSKFKVNFFNYIACFVFICWCAVAAFFRDPERKIPMDTNVLVAPADGVVKDIETVTVPEYSEIFANTEVCRIGIFLSVLDVHLNRVPCDLIIKRVVYKEGKFHDARDCRAIIENESNSILCQGSVAGIEFPLVVKQISGAIARRIVCPVKMNDNLKKGERFGMIKFGSRTELYLPKSKLFAVEVSIGDKLKAGESVIAKIKQ